MNYTFEAYLQYAPTNEVSMEGFGEIIKNAGKSILKVLKMIWDAICRAFKFLKNKIKGFFTKVSEEKEKQNYKHKAFKSKTLGFTVIPDGTKEDYEKCKNCPDLTEIPVDTIIVGTKSSWYFKHMKDREESDRRWENLKHNVEETLKQAQQTREKYTRSYSQYTARAEAYNPQDKAKLSKFFDAIESKMDANYNKIQPAIVEFKNSYSELNQMIKVYADIKTDKDLNELSNMIENDDYYERGRQLSYISDKEFKDVEWEGTKTQSDAEIIDLFDVAVNDQSGELSNFITRSLKALYEKISKRMKDAENIKNELESLAKEEERTPHPTAKAYIKSALKGPMNLFTKIASMLQSDMNRVSRLIAYQE